MMWFEKMYKNEVEEAVAEMINEMRDIPTSYTERDAREDARLLMEWNPDLEVPWTEVYSLMTEWLDYYYKEA